MDHLRISGTEPSSVILTQTWSLKMWNYRESNQVHQLKMLQKITLMKNSEFCEDMSKSKNANRVTFIIYLWLKCLIFHSFWVELCKTIEMEGQEIKISTRMKKNNFWVKYTVFIIKENWQILGFPTHGLITIFNRWSKFQNDLIHILWDMTS